MGRMTILALALLLAACSGSPRWSKAGVSPQTAVEDLSQCRHAADLATQRDIDIDNDITATRGLDWDRGGVLEVKRASLASRNRERSGDLVASCMAGKGYTPGA